MEKLRLELSINKMDKTNILLNDVLFMFIVVLILIPIALYQSTHSDAARAQGNIECIQKYGEDYKYDTFYDEYDSFGGQASCYKTDEGGAVSPAGKRLFHGSQEEWGYRQAHK